MRTLKRKTLILGAGVQASGKSTVLEQVVREVQDTVILSRDIIINAFNWERGEGERATLVPYLRENGKVWGRDTPYYGKQVCLQSYHCLLTVGMHLLEQGRHPILEGGYTREIEWGYVDAVLQPVLQSQFGDEVAVKIIFTTAAKGVIEERIRSRGEARDAEYTSAGFDAFWTSERMMPNNITNYSHIIVRTDAPIDWEALWKFLDE